MQGFRQENKALIWEQNHEIIKIEPWGRDSLRVRSTIGAEIRDDLPGALLDPMPTEIEIEVASERAAISNGKIAAEICLEEDHISGDPKAIIRFIRLADGAEILGEAPSHFPMPPVRCYKPIGSDHFRCEARFKAYEGERIYGLGQHQHGRLDQKGCVIDLIQDNTEVCIPFLFSSRGYGFLWHNPSVGRVEFGQNQTRWIAEAACQIDYWVTLGDTPAEIMEHYADATGHAPLLPEWAAGFWQCKLRYRNQEELLSIAREYRRRGLPLSVIVVDFFHWTRQGDWQFDPRDWPDPSAMVKELDTLGVKLMVSIWPTVNPLSRNFSEMEKRGLLVRTERGISAQKPFRDINQEHVYVHYYDPTNPEARQFIWECVREGYYRHGIRLWWLDACEPELQPRDPENLRYHLGNGLAVSNLYPLMHAQAFYEGMRAEREEEIITLCRSAWAGSQRYGAAVWSGDIQSTFEALRAQVRAGLNIGLSGIPWWTTDIGGFFNGDPSTPGFCELIVRWFQYGLFCPLFRLHGFRMPNTRFWDTGGPNEAWSFGEEAYRIIRELLFLRERLLPYIMEQMHLAHEKGIPPMRPLFFDFPGNEGCATVDDQFMFGPDLLVAPVLYEGQRARDVYLPDGIVWTDAWTGETLDGGQRITADAPLERIPLYLRGGKSLPIRDAKR